MKSSQVRDRFLRDRQGRVVIIQKPNLPLWVWAGGMTVTAVTHGRIQLAAGAVATAGIVVWAILELASGVNLFRRLLGLVVLLAIGALLLAIIG